MKTEKDSDACDLGQLKATFVLLFTTVQISLKCSFVAVSPMLFVES